MNQEPKNKYVQFKCSCCGAVETLQFNDNVNQKLTTKQLCYQCNYWDEKIPNGKEKNTVINGRFYFVGNKPKGSIGNGFGGRKFVIQYFDSDEIITTYDLWNGSVVPEHFRSKIPNTARFISEE